MKKAVQKKAIVFKAAVKKAAVKKAARLLLLLKNLKKEVQKTQIIFVKKYNLCAQVII